MPQPFENIETLIVKPELVDKTTRECIAWAFLPMVNDYFKDPNVQKKYNKWLQKRNKFSV